MMNCLFRRCSSMIISVNKFLGYMPNMINRFFIGKRQWSYLSFRFVVIQLSWSVLRFLDSHLWSYQSIGFFNVYPSWSVVCLFETHPWWDLSFDSTDILLSRSFNCFMDIHSGAFQKFVCMAGIQLFLSIFFQEHIIFFYFFGYSSNKIIP